LVDERDEPLEFFLRVLDALAELPFELRPFELFVLRLLAGDEER
jgi:hypothetical protein